MSLGVLLALALKSTPLQDGTSGPADYFPSQTGIVRTFLDSSTGSNMTQTTKPVVVKSDLTLVPIETRSGLIYRPDTTFYRVDVTGVFIVWFDDKDKPVKEQQPLFLWAGGNGQWTYQGYTKVSGDLVGLTLKGETRPNGKKRILEEDVETIRVKLDATVGQPPQQIVSHQELIFAKGIGIVEMSESSRLKGKKYFHTLKLIDLKGRGAPGG